MVAIGDLDDPRMVFGRMFCSGFVHGGSYLDFARYLSAAP
jgi:hypothetical protein